MKQWEAIAALCDVASICAGVIVSIPEAGRVHSKIMHTIRECSLGKISNLQAARLSGRWKRELDALTAAKREIDKLSEPALANADREMQRARDMIKRNELELKKLDTFTKAGP